MQQSYFAVSFPFRSLSQKTHTSTTILYIYSILPGFGKIKKLKIKKRSDRGGTGLLSLAFVFCWILELVLRS